jgi:hypothetical protein
LLKWRFADGVHGLDATNRKSSHKCAIGGSMMTSKIAPECFDAQSACRSPQAGAGVRFSSLVKIRNYWIIIARQRLYNPCNCCTGLIRSFAIFFRDWNLTETAA